MAAPTPASGAVDRPASPNPEQIDASAPPKNEPKKDAAPTEPIAPAPVPAAKPAAQPSPSSPPVFQTQIKWVQLLQQLFAGLMQEAAAGTGPSNPIQAAKNLSNGVEKKALANEELIGRLQSSLLKVKEESHENDKLLYAPFSERNLFVGAVNSFVVSLPLVLTPIQLRSLSTFVADSVVAALRSLLHLPQTWSGQFSMMASHGFSRLLRAALSSLVPAVDPCDFEAVNAIRPVVYTTSEAFASARLWPFSHLHQLNSVDIGALDTLFATHTAAKRTPFLLLLSLSSVPLEHMAKLVDLCKRHKVWLHIDADHTIAELVLDSPPNKYQAMTLCNSISFAPAQHIYDLPVSAFVTLFSQPMPVDTQGNGLEPVNALQQSLSLYLFMLRFGSEQLQQIVHRANSVGQAFATATGANPLLHFQISATPSPLSVAFRYIPVNTDHASIFVNRVNKQLLLDLSEHAVPLGIDVLFAKSPGSQNPTLFLHLNAIQFAWESQADTKQAQALVERFHSRLAVETNLIDSTLAHRPVFEEEIASFPALANVHVDRFLGLGAVKFFPPWLSSTGAVASGIKKELDTINTALAVRLQEQVQGLFAEARDTEGYSCVLVGVDSVALTADRARAYAQMVRKTSEALQPSRQLATNISGLVQKGIREAEEQLNREMGAQKGLMRKIPVVGSLLNWWSPTPANITGRAFDLASSSVQTVKKSSSADLSLVMTPSSHDVVRRSESASNNIALYSIGSVQRLLSSSDNRAPQYSQERKVAMHAVLLAAKVTASVQEHLISSDTVLKKDRSPVTVADLCSQAIIIKELHAAFPEDHIVAEESGKTLTKNPELKEKVVKILKGVLGELSEAEVVALVDRGAQPKPANAQRWWTLDPVDGTLGFLRKEQYAIALALMVNDQPALGVLGCPNLPLKLSEPNGPHGCILVGVRGQGAFMAALTENSLETPIHCSQETDPARLVHTTSVESGHSFADVTGLVTQAMGIVQAPIKLDSQCKYAVVARGDASVYLRLSDLTYRENIWDHAAGVIIVEEAGGRVSDMNGKPLDFAKGRTLLENLGVVCASNAIFKDVHRAVQQVNPVGELKKRAEAKPEVAPPK